MPAVFLYIEGGSKTPSSGEPAHHVGLSFQSWHVSPSESTKPGTSETNSHKSVP
jgi:hypothetical protein